MKNQWSRKVTLLTLVLSIVITTGCMDTEKKGEAKMALLKTTNPHPAVLNETKEEFAFSEDVHKYVLSFDDIYDIKGEGIVEE